MRPIKLGNKETRSSISNNPNTQLSLASPAIGGGDEGGRDDDCGGGGEELSLGFELGFGFEFGFGWSWGVIGEVGLLVAEWGSD